MTIANLFPLNANAKKGQLFKTYIGLNFKQLCYFICRYPLPFK